MDPRFKFHTTMRVRIGDINYGGHMSNDRYLLYFHDARIRFLESLGFSEADIGEGAGMIMLEAFVSYKAQVFLGDQLRIGVCLCDIGGVRFKIEYLVERCSDDKCVAKGYTKMAAFDYARRKVCKIPPAFIERAQFEVT
ncbi:acyl-CoA thioesterase [candidate division KSB1 bacterium]|nr:acyl-CoA thioesterase [candidate division KSB1 bacterium]